MRGGHITRRVSSAVGQMVQAAGGRQHQNQPEVHGLRSRSRGKQTTALPAAKTAAATAAHAEAKLTGGAAQSDIPLRNRLVLALADLQAGAGRAGQAAQGQGQALRLGS